MVVVKIKKDVSGGAEYLRNAVNYVYNPYRAHGLSAHGVSLYSSELVYHQMMGIKKYYGKTSTNPLVHFIISYDRSVADMLKAIGYTQAIAVCFKNQFQTIQCAHEKDRDHSWYHTHIVVNSVSYVDGKMLNTSLENMNRFCKYVGDITGRVTRFYFEKDDADSYKV